MDLSKDIQELVDQLDLQDHPEGGYFKEIYRSSMRVRPEWTEGIRNISTSIYFLLTSGNFSAFHRIKSDEIWHHYLGGTAEIHILSPNGDYNLVRLGKQFKQGETLQAVVPANSWFASRVKEGDDFVLAGCTVAPGFDFKDFEMANREELIAAYPGYSDVIRSLTR